MIVQERLPALGWRLSAPCHVFADGSLANVDAKLQKFAMDPGSTPEWIGPAHLADQSANFERDLWPLRDRDLQLPEQAKAKALRMRGATA